MYHDYFGLREAPFSIAPNPQYLYMSERHREALAHLLYGIRSDGGFILLTGEVGTGKTTVCRCLLEQIPEQVDIAFVLNPKLTADELLATVCDDLGISYPANASIKILVDKLNEFLLAAHEQDRRCVLIIDEAQNLSVDVLEQLRLLTNLETNQRKLLQIILLGQPELLDILARDELRQLSQRVTARFHLDALTLPEAREYVRHRLAIAGTHSKLFTDRAVREIYRLSGGIPRIINLVCDRALLGAYASGQPQATTGIVRLAAAEVMGRRPTASRTPLYAVAAAMAVVATLGLAYLNLDKLNAGTASLTAQVADAPPEVTTSAALPAPPIVSAPATSNVAPAPAIIGNIAPLPQPASRPTTPLAAISGHPREAAALADLFAVWGYYFQDQTAPVCELANDVGLMCFADIGTLGEISNLDRPVVVQLNGQWFTLTGLGDGFATVIAGNNQFDISLAEVGDQWDGRYHLVWELPPGYERPLTYGDEGDMVNLLVSRLHGNGAPARYDFDKALEEDLKRFQVANGILPDGIAGVKTWVHLNNDFAHIPRLTVQR